MKRKAPLWLLTVLALIAAACTRTGEAIDTTTTTLALLETTTTEGELQSSYVFVEAPCTDLGDELEVDITCGSVAVPANHSTGEGEFKIQVAVIASTAESPEADPVVYFDGGPGANALDTLQYRLNDFYIPLAERSDVVVFDQRGAGRSEPVANCPEYLEVFRAEQRAELKSNAATMNAFVVQALADCSQRLRDAGVPLDDINTTNNARDVDAIRQALGYPTWNLLGISYGTRLGLEVVRLFPETSRSLIIDSVFPPQVDAAAETSRGFLESYEAVVAACEAEEACAAQGNLGDRFEAAVAKLEADPMEVEVLDLIGQSSEQIFVDGDGLFSILGSSLYSPASFIDFPELLTAIEQDDPSALSLYASVDRSNEEFITIGMHYAVMCADDYSFSDYETALASAVEDPFGLSDPELEANAIFQQCEELSVPASPEVANEPVSSDVPTLVMAGSFDPVTPTSWAELAAKTLTQSQTVIFPGESHGVAPTECGIEIVLEFLSAPTEPVDTGCADDYTPVFIASSEEIQVELEVTEVSFGGTVADVLVPASWNNSADGFISDSLRGQSLLDSTEMFQYAGPQAVISSIDQSLEEQFDREFSSKGELQLGSETWVASGFSSGSIAITSLSRTYDGGVIALYLFSALPEHEALISWVLEPAAAGFALK